MKPYQVTVNYFGIKLAFRVFQVVQKNNVEIYQLKCRGLSYVVINENRSWSFLAALEPCAELQDAIVMRLKRRGHDIYQLQKISAGN